MIRRAVPSDALDISRIQNVGWQFAYAGIINQDYLDYRSSAGYLKEKTEGLKHRIEAGDIYLVAENNGALVGFVCGGKVYEEGLKGLADCELGALYIDPAFHGQGFGKALMTAFAEEIRRRFQAKTFLLGVLESNAQALGFYKRMGGKLVTETMYDYPGGQAKRLIYVYEVEKVLGDER